MKKVDQIGPIVDQIFKYGQGPKWTKNEQNRPKWNKNEQNDPKWTKSGPNFQK